MQVTWRLVEPRGRNSRRPSWWGGMKCLHCDHGTYLSHLGISGGEEPYYLTTKPGGGTPISQRQRYLQCRITSERFVVSGRQGAYDM